MISVNVAASHRLWNRFNDKISRLFFWITTVLAVICRWWRLLARIEMQRKAHVILIEKLQTPVCLLAPSKSECDSSCDLWHQQCQDLSFDHVTLCDLIAFYDKQQHKGDPVTHTLIILVHCEWALALRGW